VLDAILSFHRLFKIRKINLVQTHGTSTFTLKATKTSITQNVLNLLDLSLRFEPFFLARKKEGAFESADKIGLCHFDFLVRLKNESEKGVLGIGR